MTDLNTIVVAFNLYTCSVAEARCLTDLLQSMLEHTSGMSPDDIALTQSDTWLGNGTFNSLPLHLSDLHGMTCSTMAQLAGGTVCEEVSLLPTGAYITVTGDKLPLGDLIKWHSFLVKNLREDDSFAYYNEDTDTVGLIDIVRDGSDAVTVRDINVTEKYSDNIKRSIINRKWTRE